MDNLIQDIQSGKWEAEILALLEENEEALSIGEILSAIESREKE